MTRTRRGARPEPFMLTLVARHDVPASTTMAGDELPRSASHAALYVASADLTRGHNFRSSEKLSGIASRWPMRRFAAFLQRTRPHEWTVMSYRPHTRLPSRDGRETPTVEKTALTMRGYEISPRSIRERWFNSSTYR